LFDEFLIPFLGKLEKQIEDYFRKIVRVKAISPDKIQEFRSDFIKEFDESTQLRDILSYYSYYNLYENENGSEGSVDNFQEQLSYRQVLDKEIFFKNWYEDIIWKGQEFGRLFALQEDAHLISKLTEWSTPTDIKDFFEILDFLENEISNIFIIATNSSLNSFIGTRKEFKSILTNQELVPENLGNSLAGWLSVFNSHIPIYEVYCKPKENFVLILNKEKLAMMSQKPPQEGWQSKSRVDPEARVGYFYIGVDAFSADPVLMSSVLENPPSWLEEYQGETNQREHLETQVLLEINESFELIRDEDFEGYVMRIPCEDDDML
jgi:hypothetical protein